MTFAQQGTKDHKKFLEGLDEINRIAKLEEMEMRLNNTINTLVDVQADLNDIIKFYANDTNLRQTK